MDTARNSGAVVTSRNNSYEVMKMYDTQTASMLLTIPMTHI
jgi:hypothetical protein